MSSSSKCWSDIFVWSRQNALLSIKCLVREEVRGNREMVLIKFDLVGDGRVWEDPERLVVRRG